VLEYRPAREQTDCVAAGFDGGEIMSRYLPCLLLSLGLISGHSSASVLPTSANLNWGYTQDLGPHSSSLTAIPSRSATWPVASRLAVRANAAYIMDREFGPQLGLSNGTTAFFDVEPSRVIRSDFFPLAAGLRFYAGTNTERTRGLFLDAAPAVFLARAPDNTGGHFFKAPLGFELGGGVRFAGVDKSRFEVGLSYYHSSSIGGSGSIARPLLETPAESALTSLGLFSLYLGVGFGD